MARQRTVKPEFFRDRTIARLGERVALVYLALWCWADDGGAVRIEPDLLKGEAFARWPDLTTGVLTECLVSLHGAGRIRPYAIGDELYAVVPTLAKHQSINKPSRFRYPRGGEAVSDIKAWLSGQYTPVGLREQSSPDAESVSVSQLPDSKDSSSPRLRVEPQNEASWMCTMAATYPGLDVLLMHLPEAYHADLAGCIRAGVPLSVVAIVRDHGEGGMTWVESGRPSWEQVGRAVRECAQTGGIPSPAKFRGFLRPIVQGARDTSRPATRQDRAFEVIENTPLPESA